MSSPAAGTLDDLPDFALEERGPLSHLLRERGIATFRTAAALVRDLPYRRPSEPRDQAAVLRESCGTCSSKHAALASVALEQGRDDVDLMLGIFEMSARNTPLVAAVLATNGLESVPEAHCYLRCRGRRVDLTGLPEGPESPFAALLTEDVATPATLLAEKPRLHRAFLTRWAAERGLDGALVWEIRERCIAALSAS